MGMEKYECLLGGKTKGLNKEMITTKLGSGSEDKRSQCQETDKQSNMGEP